MLGHVGQSNGTSDDEKAADVWSGDTLIEEKEFNEFRQKRDYSEQSVLRFAKRQVIKTPAVLFISQELKVFLE